MARAATATSAARVTTRLYCGNARLDPLAAFGGAAARRGRAQARHADDPRSVQRPRLSPAADGVARVQGGPRARAVGGRPQGPARIDQDLPDLRLLRHARAQAAI